jgi:hypothetical protein
MLLDGGFRFNIIIKQLRLKLKPTPYNLRMANQTTTKLVGLRDLKIYVHDIPYTTMFIIL